MLTKISADNCTICLFVMSLKVEDCPDAGLMGRQVSLCCRVASAAVGPHEPLEIDAGSRAKVIIGL